MSFDPVVSCSFVGVGVFAQAVALMLARRPIRLLRAGGRATGELGLSAPMLDPEARGDSRVFYFPSVSFTTPQGRTICFTSRVGQKSAPTPGTKVPVLFDPERPHDAEVVSFRALWLFPFLTALFGWPFLIAGLTGLA